MKTFKAFAQILITLGLSWTFAYLCSVTDSKGMQLWYMMASVGSLFIPPVIALLEME